MEVGAIVRVINYGRNYPSYRSFLEEQGHPELMGRFLGDCNDGDIGRVLCIGPHRRGDKMLCGVELHFDGGPIIVINARAVEEVEDAPVWEVPLDAVEFSIESLISEFGQEVGKDDCV